MRKILFVLLAAMLAAVGTYAQKVNYGFKGGLNISTAHSSFQPGIYAGGFAEIKVNKHWAIQPELLYYRNRDKASYYLGDTKQYKEKGTDYIAVPVMVKYYIKPKLYVEGGPEVNLITAAKETSEGHISNTTHTYNQLGLSGSVGVGYQLPLGFGVNARYSLGTQSRNSPVDIYNSTVKVGVSYTIQRK